MDTQLIRSDEAYSSGISWPAVLAGASASAALGLILLALGTGLGLSSISPWSGEGVSAKAITGAAIIWLVAMELIASGLGGYLAGRLRTRWVTIHSDEVHFRDTAHGLLSWAVAVVVTAACLTSAAATMVGNHRNEQNSGTSPVSSDAPMAYYVDALFRPDGAPVETIDNARRQEVGRILMRSTVSDTAVDGDRDYLLKLISARTGMSNTAADMRLTNVVNDARQTTDAARRAAAHLAIWIFVALLVGAFSASLAATFGGRQRDHVVHI